MSCDARAVFMDTVARRAVGKGGSNGVKWAERAVARSALARAGKVKVIEAKVRRELGCGTQNSADIP